jgi:putative transposase
MTTPSRRRETVSYLQAAYAVSERRACRVTGTSRATCRYRSQADPQQALRLRVRELARTRVRYGYRRIHVLLRREGWSVNHKRIYRLYRDEGLAIRARTPRRRRAPQYRGARPELAATNQSWAMDFLSDTLFDGRSTRSSDPIQRSET